MALRLVGVKGFAETVDAGRPPVPPLGAGAGAGVPEGIPSAAQVMARVSGENFPVALRVLAGPTRSHLLAVYGFARLVDQLGDEALGDRSSHLRWLGDELDRAYEARAVHPVMVRLSETLAALNLPRDPFCDLIEANRRDQLVDRYASWDDLIDYCRYSANPVGRLVLAIFGVKSAELELLSDQVCTGLQVVEHTQDTGEDATRGRVYLPAQDMARFGCTEQDLLGSSAGPALRAALALQAARARALLAAGVDLVASLNGTARVAIAGFTAGGLAALDAVERADFDVLAVRCRPTRLGVCAHATSLLSAAVRSRPADGPSRSDGPTRSDGRAGRGGRAWL